ncbi:MAG: proprotein convertase P-domain-containing protein, partial [Myxococcales bacterium]|nr:proprotein convertase P-domain-containing protein [Myxococcales bacterium]
WGDGYNPTHPDFMWQPLANTPSRRDYENPHIGANYQKIVDEILSLAIEKPEPNQPTSATRFELSGSWEIKDNRPDEPTVIDVVVDTVAKVSKVTICVDVEHTYVGDLQGTLIDPSGAKRVFKKYRVYGSQKNLSNKCWNVAGFDGHDTNGTWKIEWRDNAGQDSGRVTRILMRVNDPEDTN